MSVNLHQQDPRRSVLTAIILAGGRSERMGGGDKSLRMLLGRSLLERALERLAPQVDQLLLNANGDLRRFARFGLPVLSDSLPDQPGPLAGVLAGLEWCRKHSPAAPWLLAVPCDAPFLPLDLAMRLGGAASATAEVVCAASRGRLHPTIALWRPSLAGNLRRALEDEGLRRMSDALSRYRSAIVDFPASEVDPFMNINQPEDLALAEAALSSRKS